MHPQVKLTLGLLPNLKELHWPQSIPENCIPLLLVPSLTRVSVDSISHLVADALLDVAPNLRDLDVSNVHDKQDNARASGSLGELLNASVALEELKIDLPSPLSPDTVQSLTAVPRLRKLSITLKHSDMAAMRAAVPSAKCFRKLRFVEIYHSHSIEVPFFLRLVFHSDLVSISIFVTDSSGERRTAKDILADIIPSVVRFTTLRALTLHVSWDPDRESDNEDMRRLPVHITALHGLAMLKDLRTLCLKWKDRGSFHISNTDLARLVPSWPHLRELKLPGVSPLGAMKNGKCLGPACILDLASLCPNLMTFAGYVDFSDPLYSYGPIPASVTRLSKLESLDVGDAVPQYEDEAKIAAFLAEMCPKHDSVNRNYSSYGNEDDFGSWDRVFAGVKALRIMARYQAQLSSLASAAAQT
jgi:hypothetical protein